MKEIPKDTIICYYYGRCKNHPVKKDVIVDTMVSSSSATPIDSSNQLALDTHRVEVVHQEPVNHKPSIINHQQTINNHQPTNTNHQSSIVKNRRRSRHRCHRLQHGVGKRRRMATSVALSRETLLMPSRISTLWYE